MGARHRLAREESRRRRLGRNPRCRICGETALAALTPKPGGPVCYECIAWGRSRRTVEWQHPFGRANDPYVVVGLPGNLHRVLDAMKDCWPEEVLKNPRGSPLIRCIQRALARRDWAELWLVESQAEADWLQRFEARLRAEHGDRWWDALGLPPFSGGSNE